MGALQPGRRGAALALGAILVVTGVLYAPTLGGGFAYDDEYVARSVRPDGRPNPMIAVLHPPAEYFRSTYWKGEHDARVEYRPVTIASYALVYHALGKRVHREALPQHAVNDLLHLLAVLLVYRLIRAARAGRAPALLGAALFGVHAIHSEAVASVVGRAELLAFDAGAAAVLCGIGRLGPLRVGGAVVLAFAAFGAKESAVGWLPFGVALGWARASARGRLDLRHALRCAGRAAALGALPLGAFLGLRALALAPLPDVPIASALANPLAPLSAAARIVGAIPIQAVALGKVLWPTGLASDYGAAVFDVVRSAADPRFLGALALLGGLAAGALAALPRQPLLFLAGASFFGLGFVTSNLPFAIGTIFGERLLYAPSLGVSFLAAWGLAHRFGAGGRAPAPVLASLVCAAWVAWCGALVWTRSGDWSSSETLYLADVARQPRSIRLQVLAADVYAARGDRARQFDHLQRAFALRGRESFQWTRLALLFLDQRRFAEAEEAATRGLAASAEEGAEFRFPLHGALTEALRATGRTSEAERSARRTLRAYRRLRTDPARLERLLAAPFDAAAAVRPWLEVAERVAGRSPREAERALRLGLAAARRAPPEAAFPLCWELAGLVARRGGDDLEAVLAGARSADPAAFARAVAALGPDDPRRPAVRALEAEPAARRPR